MEFTKHKKHKKMKNLLAILLVTLSLNGYAQQKDLVWHTDVKKAITLSSESNKPLLMFFTGSDWCGWCIKLQKAVFSKPEFKPWANKNVILVELDFPRRTPIDAELQKQNRELANMFGVRGYPTIFFVTPILKDGTVNFNKLGQQGAQPLEAKAWIAGANRILNNK